MKKTDSLATSLRCIECGGVRPLGYTLQCPTCGGLLELVYDEPLLRKLGTGAFTGTGLWRYAPVLPIADPAHRVSLGEGATPLLDCPRLARELGVQRLVVKFEGANPTGTVKDRSSATGVSAALQFGFGVTSVVSSGNARSSIARLLGAGGAALARLLLRAGLGAQDAPHGRHRHGPRHLQGRVRRSHHAVGPAPRGRAFSRLPRHAPPPPTPRD